MTEDVTVVFLVQEVFPCGKTPWNVNAQFDEIREPWLSLPPGGDQGHNAPW